MVPEAGMSLCRAVQVTCPEQCLRGLMAQCHRPSVSQGARPDLEPAALQCLEQHPEGLEEPAGGVLKSRKGCIWSPPPSVCLGRDQV